VLPIQTAVATGRVRAVFRGTGASSGDAVLLTVSRAPKSPAGPLVLSIPAGTMLRSTRSGFQDMVVVAVRGVRERSGVLRPAARVVAGSRPVTYVLAAYCTDGERSDPSPAVRFAAGPRDAGLACIARAGRRLPVRALQAAVWMRAEGLDVEAAARRISLGDADWGRAVDALRLCERSW
jgi:hypothetical protein